MLLVVAALMGDGRLDALTSMLRPKSIIASSPTDVWRAMLVCNAINEKTANVKCICHA